MGNEYFILTVFRTCLVTVMTLIELDLKKEGLEFMFLYLGQEIKKPLAAMTANWYLHSILRSEGMGTMK
jgi:hypothetical protein